MGVGAIAVASSGCVWQCEGVRERSMQTLLVTSLVIQSRKCPLCLWKNIFLSALEYSKGFEREVGWWAKRQRALELGPTDRVFRVFTAEVTG
jgi:hypothetical protein